MVATLGIWEIVDPQAIITKELTNGVCMYDVIM